MKMLVITLLAAAFALPAAAGSGVRYRTADFPGAANTNLFALNDHRQYVGIEAAADGIWHAIWNDGSGLAPIDTSPLGAGITYSYAFSINTQADIAGTFRDGAGQWHGFLRHVDGSFETLDYPGGNTTQDFGVNDHGDVIGFYNDAAGDSHAFKRVGGVYTTIDLPGGVETIPLSINNAGQVAGEFVKTPGTLGFGYIQEPDGTFTLSSAPGAPAESTFFISINNVGDVLGAYADADGNQQNFVRRNGKYLPVGLPARFGASFVSAQTINDGSDVVGYYIDADNLQHGATAFQKPD